MTRANREGYNVAPDALSRALGPFLGRSVPFAADGADTPCDRFLHGEFPPANHACTDLKGEGFRLLDGEAVAYRQAVDCARRVLEPTARADLRIEARFGLIPLDHVGCAVHLIHSGTVRLLAREVEREVVDVVHHVVGGRRLRRIHHVLSIRYYP